MGASEEVVTLGDITLRNFRQRRTGPGERADLYRDGNLRGTVTFTDGQVFAIWENVWAYLTAEQIAAVEEFASQRTSRASKEESA